MEPGKGIRMKKRGMVRTDFVHEEFQIAADGFDSVERGSR